MAEMSAKEAAEVLEKLMPEIESGLNTFACDRAALNYALSLCRKVAEGELIELPCKPGATVYTVEENLYACDNCPHGGEGFNGHDDCKYDGMCPLIIKEHTVEGFEIFNDDKNNPTISAPGEFGWEGLEHFTGRDGKWYLTHGEAEAGERVLMDGKDGSDEAD